MYGKVLPFRDCFSILGLRPLIEGRSPGGSSAVLQWGTATTAHQATEPRAYGISPRG